MRRQAAIIVNLFIPGAGLILLRREWLGAALALLFGVLVELGLWGCLIEPARTPLWSAVVCLVGGASVWLWGQVLLRRRMVEVSAPEIGAEVERLRDQAAEQMARERYEEAWGSVRMALSIDDEDVETNVLCADLLTVLGRFDEARRSWLAVEQLDGAGLYRRRVSEALQRLPSR